MPFVVPRLYPITDTRLSGLSHAEQIERLAAGGATLVQLREKYATPAEFFIQSLEAVKAARRLGVTVIINDRVDIALAVEAGGVHLGQDDLPPESARRLLGDSAIIGFSTHSLEQAIAADAMPVDYIAIGPVFGTSTKQDPDAVVGLEMVSEVRRRITRPLVTIGGISLATARAVIDAGADSVAVISDLVGAGDITSRAARYIEEVADLQRS
jgi:thiamine-phosphate pyrophosphorylase